ncbi:DUF721 domain-containing protein [Nocardioides alkalitolerans]|uniref:DUF721 domain-containing protein n=1 Tax=Nocardioides alkalitolerans TaxID=281714 RepID=UPI000412C1C9|nr:DciA family protein [Nocardioides alkalitolerans]
MPDDDSPDSPGDSPGDSPDSPADDGSADEITPEPEPHDASGLDLARAAAKAAAAAGGNPATGGRRTAGGRGGFGAGGGSEAGGWRRRGRRTGPTFSGPGPDGRDPQSLDRELGRVVAQRGWEVDLRVHGVFGRWAELVGDDIGGHCTPESFADGKLTVRTDSTAWATQLRLLAPSVVRRLNEELGHGTVTVIEVLGPQGPTWKKGARSVRDGRGPRDTYG